MSKGMEGKAMALIASMDTGLVDDRLIVDSGATRRVVKDFRHFKGALKGALSDSCLSDETTVSI